jgi:hypothetical protein
MLLATSPAWAAVSPIAQTIPGHYIVNYKHRASKCADLTAWPWVKWLTYQSGTASDAWVVAASSKTLCSTARKTSRTVIGQARYGDGASYQNLSDMISWAKLVQPLTRRAPKPAGAGWKCTLLPSFWGANARSLGGGSVNSQSLSGAAGAAAGAGFCENGAAYKKGKYSGGAFFSWAPDALTCKLRYSLKEVPDPSFPGSTKPISPFPASLWDDYDQVPC